MKKTTLVFLCACFFVLPTTGQNEKLPKIEISFYKSTYLYFPSKITSHDLGFKDEIDVIVDGETIKITSLTEDLGYETNLTVRTPNKLYAFNLTYAKEPFNLYHFIDSKTAIRSFSTDTEENNHGVKKEEAHLGEIFKGEKDTLCRSIHSVCKKNIIGGIKDGSVFFGLESIHIHNGRLYFKAVIGNFSNIAYDIDFIKFSTKNRKKPQRSAVQENYKTPLCIYKLEDSVLSEKTISQVFVFEKFTLSKGEELFLELQEKNGGRHFNFSVRRKDILNAGQI